MNFTNEYAVISCSNGNFKVEAEFGTPESAYVKFHQVCSAFWNEPEVIEGSVAVMNRRLEIYNGALEQIFHAAPEPASQEQSNNSSNN